MARMKKTSKGYTTCMEAIPGSDDLFMPIPDEILESEDWRVGDVLVMDLRGGNILITNKSKSLRQQHGEGPEVQASG